MIRYLQYDINRIGDINCNMILTEKLKAIENSSWKSTLRHNQSPDCYQMIFDLKKPYMK